MVKAHLFQTTVTGILIDSATLAGRVCIRVIDELLM
jgi:hypothetical protein